jgi:hypothetical protein
VLAVYLRASSSLGGFGLLLTLTLFFYHLLSETSQTFSSRPRLKNCPWLWRSLTAFFVNLACVTCCCILLVSDFSLCTASMRRFSLLEIARGIVPVDVVTARRQSLGGRSLESVLRGPRLPASEMTTFVEEYFRLGVLCGDSVVEDDPVSAVLLGIADGLDATEDKTAERSVMLNSECLQDVGRAMVVPALLRFAVSELVKNTGKNGGHFDVAAK